MEPRQCQSPEHQSGDYLILRYFVGQGGGRAQLFEHPVHHMAQSGTGAEKDIGVIQRVRQIHSMMLCQRMPAGDDQNQILLRHRGEVHVFIPRGRTENHVVIAAAQAVQQPVISESKRKSTCRPSLSFFNNKNYGFKNVINLFLSCTTDRM